jgi:CubicO group peptidase (beta-lactamase class C family)
VIQALRTWLLAALLVTAAQAIGAPPESAAVDEWARALFDRSLAERRLSGAVLTMVQDGKIVLARGYGHADYEAGTPVDPDKTRFRIGSITKTFTAMAIAQLIEDGRIGSLDDPANVYLKRLKLPSSGGVDITLQHLVTHSAGFESKAFNIASDRLFELPLSSAVIADFEPAVIGQPGRYSSYNNYGTTVLALVVEDITGQPIADYFEEHIFEPLGMTRSVLNMQPEPSEGLGVPYGFLPNGAALEIRHRAVHPFYAPVGGINATGMDMSRYMIAQLAEGLDDRPILGHDMYTRMHAQIRSNHPLSSGFGMIWFTMKWNGVDLVIHGGDWPGTHSGMVLIPATNTGLFFSLMADHAETPILESMIGSARFEPAAGVTIGTPLTNSGVLFNFLDTFYGRYQQPELPGFTPADLSDYTGAYVGRSAAFSTMERMLSLVSDLQTVNVSLAAGGDGLMIAGKGPYREIGPGVFWNNSVSVPLDGLFLDSPIFNFVRDEDGNVQYLSPQVGFDAWFKVGPLGNPQNYAAAWGLLLLLSLTAVIAVWYPRVAGRPLAKWLPAAMLAVLVAMPLVLLAGHGDGDATVNDFLLGYRGRFTWFAAAAIVAAIIALVFGWYVYLAWREKFWAGRRGGGAMRLHYSVLGMAALLFIPIFAWLHLFGA